MKPVESNPDFTIENTASSLHQRTSTEDDVWVNHEYSLTIAEPIRELAANFAARLINHKRPRDLLIHYRSELHNQSDVLNKIYKSKKEEAWSLSYEKYDFCPELGQITEGIFAIRGLAISRSAKLFRVYGTNLRAYGEEFDDLSLLGGPDGRALPSVAKNLEINTLNYESNLADWTMVLAKGFIRQME